VAAIAASQREETAARSTAFDNTQLGLALEPAKPLTPLRRTSLMVLGGLMSQTQLAQLFPRIGGSQAARFQQAFDNRTVGDIVGE
jgi:hypothetical protein